MAPKLWSETLTDKPAHLPPSRPGRGVGPAHAPQPSPASPPASKLRYPRVFVGDVPGGPAAPATAQDANWEVENDLDALAETLAKDFEAVAGDLRSEQDT